MVSKKIARECGNRKLASVLCVLMTVTTLLSAPLAPGGTAYAAGGGCGHTGLAVGEEAFLKGSGTPEDPYEISTPEQLSHLRRHLTESAKLVNDIVFEDSGYEDGGAFYNNGELFIPIGTGTENGFQGTLDGQNHAIENLKIHKTVPDQETMRAGLFSRLFGGTVYNLALKNPQIANIYPASIKANAGGGTGGIVGETKNSCIIRNVAVYGGSIYTDTSAFQGGMWPANGGVVGWANSSLNMENILVDGTEVSSVGGADTKNAVGGIAGAGGATSVRKALFTGTLQASGGSTVNVYGVAAANTTNCYYDSDKVGYSDLKSLAGTTGLDTATLQDGSLPEGFDASVWTAAAGGYPYITALGSGGSSNPPAGSDISYTTIVSGGIVDSLAQVSGYGTANTLIKAVVETASGKLEDNETLVYDDGVNKGTFYYSNVLNAYLCWVPVGSLDAAAAASHITKTAGTTPSIKYGVIAADREFRSSVGFKDLYYFDKTVVLGSTIPGDGIEHVLAMDVNGDFELTSEDMTAIIHNYVFGTPFTAKTAE